MARTIVTQLSPAYISSSSIHVVAEEINRCIRQVNSGRRYVGNTDLRLIGRTGRGGGKRNIRLRRRENGRGGPVWDEKYIAVGSDAAQVIGGCVHRQRIR